MPPTRKARTKSRSRPYAKSKNLVLNLTTFLKEHDVIKKFQHMLGGRGRHGKSEVIRQLVTEVIEFIKFHTSKSTIGNKLQHLEIINDHVSLYDPELHTHVVETDGGQTLLYAMAIPYYSHIAYSVLTELSDELDIDLGDFIEIIEKEINGMMKMLFKRTAPKKKSPVDKEIDELSRLMGKLL